MMVAVVAGGRTKTGIGLPWPRRGTDRPAGRKTIRYAQKIDVAELQAAYDSSAIGDG
jgi:hypothetical protein